MTNFQKLMRNKMLLCLSNLLRTTSKPVHPLHFYSCLCVPFIFIRACASPSFLFKPVFSFISISFTYKLSGGFDAGSFIVGTADLTVMRRRLGFFPVLLGESGGGQRGSWQPDMPSYRIFGLTTRCSRQNLPRVFGVAWVTCPSERIV